MDAFRSTPLIALSYFAVAARTRSFAAAARELQVTPAAISHQIKALEACLGVELFVRRHRSVDLTRAARTVLPLLQDGFASLADAVAQLRSAADPLRASVVTVCAEPLFATKWLVPRLHRFYAHHPELEVRLQASLRSVDGAPPQSLSIASYERAGVDVSIRLGYGDYPQLYSRCLIQQQLVPVVAPELVTRNAPADALLTTLPLLCDGLPHRAPGHPGWREWFRHTGKDMPFPFRERRFDSSVLALEAALAGHGVLLACKDAVRPDIDAGKLRVLCEEAIASPLSYHLVGPHSALDRPPVHAFTDWLLAEAGASHPTRSLP